MRVETALAFGEYRLDPVGGQLMKGSVVVPLAPKAFALLQHLATNAGRLVPKQELLETVWPDVFVGDAVLKVTIRELRKALEDDSHAPRFIETAHRRGYRFVAAVTPVVPPDAGPTAPARAPETPRVSYARSGSVNIAYQVVGSGPVDLVFVMGWVSHLEYFWNEPSFARFLTRLGAMARLILFDKRGTGLSDPVPIDQLPTLEQRLDDVRAVMEAAGAQHAVLLGISEGGPLCSLFAATYPEKTDALVMIGSYARRMKAPDYPWGRTVAERDAFCARIVEEWGGPVGIEERAPSKMDDPVFRDWWASYLRMGSSPGAAVALTRMNADIDIRDLLPSIRVPTLVLHRTGDQCLKVEEGRYLASRIPGAQLVELPGDDHLPFVGDQDAMLAEIERFLTGTRDRAAGAQVLATVLVMLSEADPGDAAHLHDVFAREVAWYRGRQVPGPGGRLVALFDGPARAARCGSAVATIAARSHIRVRAGVHIGECDPIAGAPVADVASRIASLAAPNQVLVSRTVVDLVPGSGLQFDPGMGLSIGAGGRQVALLSLTR